MIFRLDQDHQKTQGTAGAKYFQKLLTVFLFGGIIILSGLIGFYVLNPEPGYFNIGILNSEKKAEQYPTTARVREKIEFYVTVENQLNRNFAFQIRILTGDENTELTSDGSREARLRYIVGNVTLFDGEKWISSKLWISFYKPGQDNKIIIELWEITAENELVFKDILWLRLTIYPR